MWRKIEARLRNIRKRLKFWYVLQSDSKTQIACKFCINHCQRDWSYADPTVQVKWNPPFRRRRNLQPCYDNESLDDGVTGSRKMSKKQELWPVVVYAMDLKRVALEEIFGVMVRHGLKQGLLRMQMSVKELCSVWESRWKRCENDK